MFVAPPPPPPEANAVRYPDRIAVGIALSGRPSPLPWPALTLVRATPLEATSELAARLDRPPGRLYAEDDALRGEVTIFDGQFPGPFHVAARLTGFITAAQVNAALRELARRDVDAADLADRG